MRSLILKVSCPIRTFSGRVSWSHGMIVAPKAWQRLSGIGQAQCVISAGSDSRCLRDQIPRESLRTF